MLRKQLIVAAAGALGVVGALGVGAPAHASVQRYQMETVPYLVTVNGTYQHSYLVTINPCDGTFTGTGQYPPAPNPAIDTETISGSVTGNGTVINYTAVYTNTSNPQYQYSLVNGAFDPRTGTFTGTGNDNDGNSAPGSLQISGSPSGAPTFTSYANHGQFVSSQPNSNDAAHSCIGMPVQSRN